MADCINILRDTKKNELNELSVKIPFSLFFNGFLYGFWGNKHNTRVQELILKYRMKLKEIYSYKRFSKPSKYSH